MSESEFHAIQRYYRNKAVRARVHEFCGGTRFSCEYLVGFGEYLAQRGYQRPLRVVDHQEDLPGLMEEGLDLSRAVWDSRATLAIWDVEYYNLDSWTDLYRKQLKYFALMEPTYKCIEQLFSEYGIPHLSDTTASGYHFISLIPFSSPVHKRLEEIGNPEKSLREKYALIPGGDNKRRRPVPERDGNGYSGIGRLMEFLSHRVMRMTRAHSELAIQISDIATAHSERGREGMNLDITQYGDPLFMRTIRTSFSTHQKHKIYVGRVGEQAAKEIPVFATVPRDALSSEALFEIRRDLGRAAEHAASCSSVIPDGARGWGKVIDDYIASPLYTFHKEFDSIEHEPPEKWADTYWRLDVSSIPPCVANPIRNANPGLLVPTSIQNVCRILYSKGWRPKHIGGLIRSYYEQNLGWGTDWSKYHAETRANFWARIYCGLIATGLDSFVDFNCVSYAEKGFCPSPWCGHNLHDFRDAILKKRNR